MKSSHALSLMPIILKAKSRIAWLICVSLLFIDSSCISQHAAGRLERRSQELRDAGDLESAIVTIRQAVAIRERQRAREPIEFARSLRALAQLHYERDEHEHALQAARRALSELHAHADRIGRQLNVGQVHRRARDRGGRFGPRESHREEPFRMQASLSNGALEGARVAITIATIQRARGEYEAALTILRQAVAYVRTSGRSGWRLDLTANVAAVHRDQADEHVARRRYRLAARAYVASLATWQELTVTERAEIWPDIALTLVKMGDLYLREGKRGPARALLRRALAMNAAWTPEKSADRPPASRSDDAHPLWTAIEMLRAQLQHGEKSYEQAHRSYRGALHRYERRLGKQHPDVARTLTQLAMLHEQRGEETRALQLASHAETLRVRTVDRLIGTGSAREKRRFMMHLRDDIDATLSLGLRAEDPSAHELVALTLLRYKGRILDAMSSSLASLRSRLDTQSAALLADYQAARSQYATHLLRGPEQRTPQQHVQLLAGLEQRLRDLEAAISVRSGEFSARQQAITLAAVQAVISPDTALVEWVRYRPNDRVADDDSGEQRYAACVVRSHGRPACVNLGDAAVIDQLIGELYRAARIKLASFEEPARQLSMRLMDPLGPHLAGVSGLLLVPDGQLHLAPLAILQDERGRTLLERYRLTYLTSGRELVRHRHREPPRTQGVVVAAPDYGSGRGNFQPLPATLKEAEFLSENIPSAAVFTGRQASEYLLKNLHGPNLLHIATHGYNHDHGCADSPPVDGDPMLQVGLALSGANRCSGAINPDEDGLLSAHELAALDLQGTQLAVLSSCGSGVGDLDIAVEQGPATVLGEGLYSLRRALVLAGARTQLVTLWQVDDNATRHVMQEYYRELLAGTGRSEALRRVQLELQSRGVHPFYWAGFIVSGEGGAISLPTELVASPTPMTGARSPRGCGCGVLSQKAGLNTRTSAHLLWLLLPIWLIARRYPTTNPID